MRSRIPESWTETPKVGEVWGDATRPMELRTVVYADQTPHPKLGQWVVFDLTISGSAYPVGHAELKPGRHTMSIGEWRRWINTKGVVSKVPQVIHLMDARKIAQPRIEEHVELLPDPLA